MKMNRKGLVAFSVILLILVSLFGSTYFTALSSPVLPGQYNSAYYNVVDGVLDEAFPDGQPTDFDLYPYEHNSLKIGFSKYGELIGIQPGLDPDVQANWAGLEYSGTRDPFCPPTTAIPMTSWFNGWFIDIEYTGGAVVSPRARHVWAFALFADGETWGFDWQFTDDPAGAPHGGRKTNAYAETENYKVLYHGPRRFVVQMITHIYDTNTLGVKGWPLVDVIITIVFDKVKKEIILFKDIKLTIEKGRYIGKVDVEFSNREQWDLGPAPAYASYAYFYEQYGDTCYGPDWHLAQNLTRERHETHYGTELADLDGDTIEDDLALDVPAAAYAMASGFVMVWVDDDPYGNPVFKTEPEHYTVNYAGEYISFKAAPAATDKIEVHYKYIFKIAEDWNHEYDLAQVISSDESYVGWTAMWPPVSDYTVDGMGIFLSPLLELQVPDIISTTEPMQSPLIIGEWDFLMDREGIPQFRCVEVKGVTDLHDAEDADMGAGYDNVIDREVMYQLNGVFNPWDLNDAVHKQESRWVYYDESLSVETDTIDLTDLTPNGLDDLIYQPNGYIETEESGYPWSSATWTGYNYTLLGTATFDWKNEFEDEIDAYSKNWVAHLNSGNDEAMLKVTPTGYGVNITGALTFDSIVDFGFWYYALTGAKQGPHIEFELYNSTGTGYVVLGAYANSPNAPNHPYIEEWTHYTLNGIGNFLGGGKTSDTAFYIRYCPDAVLDDLGVDITTYAGAAYCHSWEWFQERLGNFSVGSVGVSMRYDGGPASQCYIDDLSVAYLEKASGIRYERVYNMEEDKLVPSEWDQYCSFAERVLIDGELVWRYPEYFWHYWVTGVRVPYYIINFENGTLTFYHWVTGVGYRLWELPVGTEIKVLYSTIEENEKGRYEWIIVGRDSAPVDSAGAAMVSEYFDSLKDIDVWNSGLDMQDETFGLATPYVFEKLRTTLLPNSDAYRNGTWGPNTGRSKLRDDWCTSVPIESSNIIGVGGPGANLLLEYLNDFTDAYYDRTEYEIVPLTCWSITAWGTVYEHTFKPTYVAGEQTIGYGVISVYKDLDGTTYFVIWGHSGQDTYYTSWILWNWLSENLDGHQLGLKLQELPDCMTTVIIEFDYTEHPTDTSFWSLVETLGTISEYNNVAYAQPPIHPDP